MFDKLDIGKMFLEKFGSMFGNMFGMGNDEFDYENGLGNQQEYTQQEYTKENVMFEQQSKMGRAKGEIQSPEPMRKQITNFYKIKKDLRSGQGVVSTDFDEEDTLG